MADDPTGSNHNTNASATTESTPAPDWRQGLGELAGHDRIVGFKSTKELAEAYVNSPKPRKLPASVDEYKVPEEVKIKGLRSMALANKISQDQLDGILKFNRDLSSKTLQSRQEQHTKDVKALKDEWGDKYDSNLKLAKKALKQYDSEDESVSKLLKAANMSDNPSVMRFMHKLGKALGEDTFVESSGNVKKGKASLAERLFPNHPGQR